MLEVDRRIPGGADPGGGLGPGARGPASRARVHAAPLPPVVRVLHARRVDRNEGGRALRDALHAHRRPRRVGAGGDPGRPLGVEAASRLGSGAKPRSDAARLRGDPGGDHRGLGAGPGAAPVQALVRGGIRLLRGGAEAVRELAQSGLNPANCRLLDEAESALTHAGPAGKALLVLGFESAHHPIDAAMDIALEVARDHGGEPGEVRRKEEERHGAPRPRASSRGAARFAPTRRPRPTAATRSAPGATPSSPPLTCATRSSPAAC